MQQKQQKEKLEELKDRKLDEKVTESVAGGALDNEIELENAKSYKNSDKKIRKLIKRQ